MAVLAVFLMWWALWHIPVDEGPPMRVVARPSVHVGHAPLRPRPDVDGAPRDAGVGGEADGHAPCTAEALEDCARGRGAEVR